MSGVEGGEESGQASGAHPLDALPRVLSLWDASMLIVASVIGAGIFFTPGQVARLLDDPRLILLAWLTGALLSLAGALANAELGAMFPRAGGNYIYLREGFHPAAGFLVGWLGFFAIYAGTLAALAVVLADAVAARFGWGETGAAVTAVVLILSTSLLNWRGVLWGATANNLTSAAKIVALALFVILGPIWGEGSFEPWFSAASDSVGAASTHTDGGVLRFGQALSPILFSYLGWNASVFVASEIRDPERNVPRSLMLGLAICAALYLAVNAVYLYALSPEEITQADDAGAAAALGLFGPVGASWVGAFVFVSVIGTLNATALVGPRIAYAMALDGLLPGRAARVHQAFRTPGVAIAGQAVVASVLVLVLGNFPAALDFTVFAIVLATCADVGALFALRIRQPRRIRPYRTWGYPWLPGLYLVVNAGVGVALIVSSPRECLISLGFLAAGLLLYFGLARRAVTE